MSQSSPHFSTKTAGAGRDPCKEADALLPKLDRAQYVADVLYGRDADISQRIY